MQMINRDLTSDKDGIPGYIAHPNRKGPGPGVLIVHHHFGVTGHMKANVCNFAKLGYTTIVPDLYKLLGLADGVHEGQKKITDGQYVEAINQSWRYLTARSDVDAKRCAVVGYCMGGRIGLHFGAATPSVRAFKCPSQIFFGAQDRVAPIAMQQRLMANFQANGQPLDWHFFHRAGHGFALADGDSYDPRLAELSWELTSDFLGRALRDE